MKYFDTLTILNFVKTRAKLCRLKPLLLRHMIGCSICSKFHQIYEPLLQLHACSSSILMNSCHTHLGGMEGESVDNDSSNMLVYNQSTQANNPIHRRFPLRFFCYLLFFFKTKTRIMHSLPVIHSLTLYYGRMSWILHLTFHV